MLEDYKNRTTKAAALWGRSQRLFPGGINHNIRTFGTVGAGAYPPFIQRGKGCHIWDVDGNEYVDWWMTHYSEILGHDNDAIKRSISDQLENGIHFGALNEYQVRLAEIIQEAIPTLERMRFCTTGSEATMYATRLARQFTGRRLVAKALGGWHGGNDTLCFHLSHPFDDRPLHGGVSFDFNDTYSVDQLIREHGEELAAIVVEPVLGAGGGIPPSPDFLPYLREVTERHGVVLIFDEIVTAFRLAYGDAGTHIFGVKPDLLTLGKVAGGGMPIGVYGGREDIMRLASSATRSAGWVGGGTFSCHPLSMVAGIAALNELGLRRSEYASLNARGDCFRDRINRALTETGCNMLATGYGSILFIHALKKPYVAESLTGSKLAAAIDRQRQDVFQALLLEQGVLGHHGLGAMSFAHGDRDLDFTLDAIQHVVNSGGFQNSVGP
ncbi:MAG: aminotransferase class III-fold pyridoxal phosphate-dependent enzyme [Candidatus Thorarchaeota archaeon]